MVGKSAIRYLIGDWVSLQEYLDGKAPDFGTLKRRIFLLDRESDTDIPDQYYRLNGQLTFAGIKNLQDLLTDGLYRLSCEYLEMVGNKICVKAEKFNEWQFFIADIPPLLLQMAFLSGNKILNYTNFDDVANYYKDYILPNCHYTAIPSPHIPEMESINKLDKGFNDLHIHLNGSTEFDLVWQFCLRYPSTVQYYFSQKSGIDFVKELCEQEHVNGSDFQTFLIIAQTIKNILFELVYKGTAYGRAYIDTHELLSKIFYDNRTSTDGFSHLIYNSSHIPSEFHMALEGLMYVIVFSVIRKTGNLHTATLLHFYLQIMGLFNRLLVQQNSEKGFDQFQKFTLTDLRGRTEEKYLLLFKQLNGNGLNCAKYIEGRFAPKSSVGRNVSLLRQIITDWEKLQFADSELKLVGHFIKNGSNKKKDAIRYGAFRSKLWIQTISFIFTLKQYTLFKAYVKGYDAASNELSVPPDVFASDFRKIRRECDLPLTYHAGEDFYSIVGGIRAVFEAVYFLEMKSGDRIGHACALGLSAQRWFDCVNDTLNISQGELLDNLVFICHIMDLLKIESLDKYRPYLAYKISDLCNAVYGKNYSINSLIKAWEWRKYNPSLVMADYLEMARIILTYDGKEWMDICNSINKNSDAYEIYCKFQRNECYEAYNKVISIKPSEYLDAGQVTEIQLAVLEYMNSQGIIIEALPTSNIHIGYYSNFDAYHIWNWYKWTTEGRSVPPVVLGTDDCGIFSTNIFNEYAHLFCNLVFQHKKPRIEALKVIRQICDNSEIYKFGE